MNKKRFDTGHNLVFFTDLTERTLKAWQNRSDDLKSKTNLRLIVDPDSQSGARNWVRVNSIQKLANYSLVIVESIEEKVFPAKWIK